MAKKQYWLVVDVETTISDKVADFGAVIVSRDGTIHNRCGVMVSGIFGVDSLFYDRNAPGIWSKSNVQKRMDNYNQMVENGTRVIASVNAINRWLEKAVGKYDPEMTAYNLAFDTSRCAKTGIDLSILRRSFCLWHASVGNICRTRKYRQFVMDNHLFNTPTKKGNMTFRTDAEAVTGYLNGQMTEEPHTSVEDIVGYEIPTLVHILKKRGWRDNIEAYNWRHFQVKKHFKVG